MRIKDRIGEETYISGHVPKAALYEHLAEEASELAQAALKYARILRGEDPTPLDPEQAMKDLVEEYTDVGLIASTIDLKADLDIYLRKLHRWYGRLTEAKSGTDIQ